MRGVGLLAAMLALVNFLPLAAVWAGGSSNRVSPTETVLFPSVLQQTVTVNDVSVTNVSTSSTSVSQGDVVTVAVTAQNLGSATETFDVNLSDDTDSRAITTVSLSLEPGQSITLGLPWNTASASGNDHLLTASADLSNDQNRGNDSMTIASPVTVALTKISLGDSRGFNPPRASFGNALDSPTILSQAPPQSVLFIGGDDANFGRFLSRAAVTTNEARQGGIYVANADATFQPAANFQNPFQQGEVRGVVHLKGSQYSSGAYVAVGPDRHFADVDGRFQFLIPNGTYDFMIQAPGYVPVRIPVASIKSGEVITMPELTLPFGDANGDGRIDILDLSMAAENFGATVTEVRLP